MRKELSVGVKPQGGQGQHGEQRDQQGEQEAKQLLTRRQRFTRLDGDYARNS
jgi:hypothetical protein